MKLNWDQFTLLALKFVRMFAYGQTSIILVQFLSSVGFSDENIGLFMALTLLGDVLVSMVVAAISHRNLIQRRTLLAISGTMMLASGVVFALCSNYWGLLLASIIGVVSPSGDEVGPFMPIESAMMAHVADFDKRVVLFGIQGMLGTFGLALGLITGGYISEVQVGHVSGQRLIFWLYALFAAVLVVMTSSLSPACELADNETVPVESTAEEVAECVESEATPLLREEFQRQNTDTASQPSESLNSNSDETVAEAERRIRAKAPARGLSFVLSLIFGIDSLAYGFMPNSWLAEYMHRHFKSSISTVGSFLFIAQLTSAITSVPSIYLTHSLGPVLAIGFTKLAAGTFGGAIPLASTAYQAMGFVLFRSLFDTMDVVPRQTFLTSVVPKDQTVTMLSLVNIIKTFARSISPIFTGVLAAQNRLWIAFILMGGLEWVFGLIVIALFY